MNSTFSSIEPDFVQWLDKIGIHLDNHQLDQFRSYYSLLIKWNEKMNLTALTGMNDVYLKHFYDSVLLSTFIDVPGVVKMADIGAGAGFPSLPVKIIYPHMSVTIVDSLNKRVTFLRHLIQQLGLDKVEVIHGRAEELGRMQPYRDAFDLVSARAVARLNVLVEYCLPFVKMNGFFIAMKAARVDEELNEAKKAIRALKGELVDHLALELPVENAERHLLKIKKLESTPRQYPRKPGMPAKQPII